MINYSLEYLRKYGQINHSVSEHYFQFSTRFKAFFLNKGEFLCFKVGPNVTAIRCRPKRGSEIDYMPRNTWQRGIVALSKKEECLTGRFWDLLPMKSEYEFLKALHNGSFLAPLSPPQPFPPVVFEMTRLLITAHKVVGNWITQINAKRIENRYRYEKISDS